MEKRTVAQVTLASYRTSHSLRAMDRAMTFSE